jgi:cobalt/nickel transport system permease protein
VSGHDTAEATVETPLHRAPAETKLAATVLFVVAVALIPRGRLVWPYAVDAVLLAGVAIAARTPVSMVAGRLAIEAPFVLFVVLLPFVVDDGGWLAFGIAAKATLAVLATGVLAWTTPAPEILRGAERLGTPRLLTAIAGFALRYLQVLLDEFRRMRLARALRGDGAHWWPRPRVLGALALRSFERGERVHAAMLARGYDGRMPQIVFVPRARPAAWLVLAFPAAAFAVLGVAL